MTASVEFAGKLVEGDTVALKGYEQVVDQVGSLVHEPFVVAVDRFDYRLDGLFAHLLRDALGAAGVEAGGVGRGRIGVAAALYAALPLLRTFLTMIGACL